MQGGRVGRCLLDAGEVNRVKALYGPTKSKGGLELYPGPTISAALAPSLPAKGDAPALAAPLGNALKEFGYSQTPTLATFDADQDIAPMERLMNPVMSAVDPDLSKFKARGGKVVAWQGWGDPAISPYNTLHYYDTVAAKTGGNMDDFYRVFFVPGMGHCGAGATGPTSSMRWLPRKLGRGARRRLGSRPRNSRTASSRARGLSASTRRLRSTAVWAAPTMRATSPARSPETAAAVQTFRRPPITPKRESPRAIACAMRSMISSNSSWRESK